MSITMVLSLKVAQMFVILITAFLLVKAGFFKPEYSKVLSKVVLFIVTPSLHIVAFQTDRTPETVRAFGIAVAAALFMHAVVFLISMISGKMLKLDGLEQASIMYTNQGNLLVPLITSVLGTEYILYLTGFMLIQIPLMFSHGRMLIGGDRKLSLKKIVCNIGFFDIIVGFTLFITNIRFPSVISGAMNQCMNMAGPMCMIIAGMTLGSLDLKSLFTHARVYFITFMKLFAAPAVLMLVFAVLHVRQLVPGSDAILYIAFLCAAAPSASSIVSIAQVYGGDAEKASHINCMTTLFCVVSIPLMSYVYEHLIGV